MDGDHVRAAVAAAAGTGYLLAGAVLLLQELDLVTVPWPLVVPLLLLVTGLALLVTARPARGGRETAGAPEDRG